ncbi:Spy/CpxP family protein refolding chaperone [Aestuariivirga sp.]|jgi:hypothetical protein|uniref:Spy/CpxP family protein refolding chaperone n=1 Tax=Aestuariivirga sp. TaxID=2650926 RepID=UPI003782D7B6
MKIAYAKLMAAAGLLVVAISVPAMADSDDDGWWPRWGTGRGMMDGWGWGGPMMGYGPDAMLDRIDGRLAYMKTELKITDAQGAAWDELAEVIRNTAETHNAMMREMMKDVRSGDFLKKPLPERLTLQQTHMEARLEQIKSVKAAVDKLYALLDDTQKKTADDIVLPSMGMGMGRGMGSGMMLGD